MNPPNGFGANGMGVSTNGYQHGNLSRQPPLWSRPSLASESTSESKSARSLPGSVRRDGTGLSAMSHC
ncbi:hypothetical protein GCM10017668_37010 [Streptomyces tuirus]|uniref:Uncharacterized protein n=1 Tax=Streptomyces tuirus TaxID=68278 RepID=A0A7G1NFB9_9ACTN|nr:hypothetical protein GCM10017668_37010 [Streptomyces tuirus]